jgi:hypothetical protein
MPDEIQAEWTYEPPDLFEERAELLIDRCAFVIDAGRVTVCAPFEGNPDTDISNFCNELHQRLDALLLAAQMLTHKAYVLSKPGTIVRISQDGRRHFYVLAELPTNKITGGAVDILITDAAGNVTKDTRKERIDGRKKLAQIAAAQISDPVANSILRSYSAAVNDPRNELVHLYEIREALSTHFGGDKKTQAALNVSDAKWRRLGALACDEPLLQGRHRGKHPGALRAATQEELSEARAIARGMVEAFLTHP